MTTTHRHPSPGRAALRAALAVGVALAASRAGAHEVLHEIVRGSAVAVHAYESDGDPLDDRAYEVYSPADPKVPWQRGRTDRRGWLAFVPDAPGLWRVRVIDEGGHGLDLGVEVAAGAGAARAAPPGALPAAAFVLRPLVGVAVIGAVFAGLILLYRRRGRAR
jgi:nickel transport protein